MQNFVKLHFHFLTISHPLFQTQFSFPSNYFTFTILLFHFHFLTNSSPLYKTCFSLLFFTFTFIRLLDFYYYNYLNYSNSLSFVSLITSTCFLFVSVGERDTSAKEDFPRISSHPFFSTHLTTTMSTTFLSTLFCQTLMIALGLQCNISQL